MHPQAERVDGESCYRSLQDLLERVGGVLIVTPPSETEKVVREAATAGITRVWMQQGDQSDAAIQFCAERGMCVVHGECILMFAQPTGVHKFHHFLWRLLGRLPH